MSAVDHTVQPCFPRVGWLYSFTISVSGSYNTAMFYGVGSIVQPCHFQGWLVLYSYIVRRWVWLSSHEPSCWFLVSLAGAQMVALIGPVGGLDAGKKSGPSMQRA